MQLITSGLSNPRRCVTTLLLIFVVMALNSVDASVVSAQVRTDLGVYPEPSLQALPRAGTKIIDPVFGTTIQRLTDGSLGDSQCTVSYATVPVFNVNSTRAYVRCNPNTRARFFQFNPTTFTASSSSTIPASSVSLYQFWMLWSGTNPDLIYGTNGINIYAYNVATKTLSPVVNGTETLLSSERFNWQMSKSANDDVFASTFTSTTSQNIGYVVWRRSDKKQLLKIYESVDEVEIDKTGRYLVVSRYGGGTGIWDLQAKFLYNLPAGFYHRGLGQGTALTVMNYGSLGYRSLSTPTILTKLLPDRTWSYEAGQQDHFSMLADNERWGLGSRYSKTGTGVRAAFDNEIVQVATDGSLRVRRLAHHRSVVLNNYYATPMANISRDGKFVAFTSNWGNSSGRLDVYVVQVPPAQ